MAAGALVFWPVVEAAGGEPVRTGGFCCSMYWRGTLIGAPPTDPAKQDPDTRAVWPANVRVQVGNSCRSLREDTALRELTRPEMVTVGGKFTSRCTCSASPLNSASSAPKSAHTSRMISSIRSRQAELNTWCRYLATKTKSACRMKTQCLPARMSLWVAMNSNTISICSSGIATA
jgi:hypothetical protein